MLNRILFIDGDMARTMASRRAARQGRRFAICRHPLGYCVKPLADVVNRDNILETVGR